MNNDIRVPGFLANGISCGIKDDGKKDLSLIFSETPAEAAAVFTTNIFRAAPVIVAEERVRKGKIQAIIANSGNANAATGAQGHRDACAVTGKLAKYLNIDESMIVPASTGIIGEPLPVDRIIGGIGTLADGLKPDGIESAAEAILTTDTFPKIAQRTFTAGGRDVRVCGIAKGAGMIEPDMATMLSFIMTDMAIGRSELEKTFRKAVDASFNAISVDGCMSTNDCVVIMANGHAENRLPREGTRDVRAFFENLLAVTDSLSRSIVQDGEGATKVITITVEGARTKREARKLAGAIANSNLVKTAFFGGDPNWGRIVSAAGAAGIQLIPEALELFFEEVLLFEKGMGVQPDRGRIREIMQRDAINVRVNLGMGNKSFRMYTSDLSYEYVKINALYHS